MTVGARAGRRLATIAIAREGPFDVAAHEKIQASVVVVIEEAGAGTPGAPPTLISATPGLSTTATQTFAVVGRDADGFADISRMYFLVNNNSSIPTGSCHGFYNRGSNWIFLYNDGLTTLMGPLVPGTPGTIQNGQCAINGASSSVAAAGTDLMLNLSITRQGAYANGVKNLYIWVTDDAATGTGWIQTSTWTLGTTPPTAPNPSSATPASSTTATQSFAITGRDANGFADISRLYFLVNNNPSIPAGSCHGFYDRVSNSIFLYNDALAVLIGPLTPGTNGVIQNGQCAIIGAASSVTASGTDLLLNLSIRRQGSYATGARNLYIWVTDNANTGTGWVQVSVWTLGMGVPHGCPPDSSLDCAGRFDDRDSDLRRNRPGCRRVR